MRLNPELSETNQKSLQDLNVVNQPIDKPLPTLQESLQKIAEETHPLIRCVRLPLGQRLVARAWKIVTAKTRDDQVLRLSTSVQTRVKALPDRDRLVKRMTSSHSSLREVLTEIQDVTTSLKAAMARTSQFLTRAATRR